MHIRRVLFILFTLIIVQTTIADNSKVGVVLLIKGEVIITRANGYESYLKRGDPIFEKSSLRTGPKSFVRIVFDDRSSLNLASNSHLQINHYPKNNPGVLSLIKGKVRTLVKKDYLKWRREKNKSKLFIKTENAAMGVRGTDFIVEFDPPSKETNLDVITGQVAMANLGSQKPKDINTSKLDQLLYSQAAVMVNPGMRSSVINRRIPPAKPQRIPKKTLNQLQKQPNSFVQRHPQERRMNKFKRIEKGQEKQKMRQQKSNGQDQLPEIEPNRKVIPKNKVHRPRVIPQVKRPIIQRPVAPKPVIKPPIQNTDIIKPPETSISR